MTPENLARANQLQRKIARLEGEIEIISNPSTALLYQPEQYHREDAQDFPEEAVPVLRAAAVQVLQDQVVLFKQEFARI